MRFLLFLSFFEIIFGFSYTQSFKKLTKIDKYASVHYLDTNVLLLSEVNGDSLNIIMSIEAFEKYDTIHGNKENFEDCITLKLLYREDLVKLFSVRKYHFVVMCEGKQIFSTRNRYYMLKDDSMLIKRRYDVLE